MAVTVTQTRSGVGISNDTLVGLGGVAIGASGYWLLSESITPSDTTPAITLPFLGHTLWYDALGIVGGPTAIATALTLKHVYGPSTWTTALLGLGIGAFSVPATILLQLRFGG